jgi:hypothetical protein
MRKSKKKLVIKKRNKIYTRKHRKCVYTDETKRIMRITKELKKQQKLKSS